MLEHTFCHIPSIGVKTESRLWEAGLRNWSDLEHSLGNGGAAPLGRASKELVRDNLAASVDRLSAGDANWFGERLLPAEQWRLYADFMDQAAYVDIETTGTAPPSNHITTIALYDGTDVKTYVWGDNLEQFADDILQYKLLVTFNGRCFDAPFIEKSLKIQLPKAHLDLRNVLKAAGVTGGLKKAEKHFGLDRGELDGVDGYWAVLLWREYRNLGKERFLRTLLAYNIEDVLSLEALASRAFNILAGQTLVGGSRLLEEKPVAPSPIQPDPRAMDLISRKYANALRRR